MSKYASLHEFVESFPRRTTNEEIAAQLGIPVAALYRYLAGTVPRTATALRLSREHEIALEGLLDPPVPEAVER